MKTLYFLFTTDDTWISKFLRWYQRTEYSHVEMYDVHQDKVIGARPNGVGLFKKTNTLKGYKYIVKTLEVTDSQYETFYNFLYSKIGSKYDWAALFGFLLNDKKYQEADKWFCSELIYAALLEADIYLFDNLEPWNTMPRDLLVSPLLKRRDDIMIQ